MGSNGTVKKVFRSLAAAIFSPLEGRRRGERITSPPDKVRNEPPTAGEVNQQLDKVITWLRPKRVQTYDVWFGPSEGSMAKVSTGQLPRFFVPTLELDSVYYFRIDAKNTLGTTLGDVHYFFTWSIYDIETDENGVPLTDEEGKYLETGEDSLPTANAYIDGQRFYLDGKAVFIGV